ncbi:hypothetical protein M9H77_01430 [Catharanthus roseus]|uniref:Uncharacterized protein n=1 Tax=Catharanthus roseus TaxID=4058 RepID=A0ACC0C605_CATRO|nr:hypothetical protein M9H77_01430 [Catharanthus roseus]
MKWQKRSNNAKIEAINNDWLSGLPDDILCKILSFIPTKDVVATSLLSTRWKYLYRSVPTITLNDFLSPQNGESTVNRFIRITSRVLLLRNVFDLHKFHLICNRLRCNLKINEWIYTTLCHNVRDLNVQLPNLILYQSTAKGDFITKPESLEPALEGCPPLEELCLRYIDFEKIESLDLSSSSLRIFSVSECSCMSTIILDNPNVVHLKLWFVYGKELIVKNLKALAVA